METVEQYLARGGKITVIPYLVRTEDNAEHDPLRRYDNEKRARIEKARAEAPGELTEEDLANACAMRQDGHSWVDIGATFGLSAGAIGKRCRRLMK